MEHRYSPDGRYGDTGLVATLVAMTPQHILTLGSITYWRGGYDYVPDPDRAVGRVVGSWQRLDRLGEVIRQGLAGEAGLGPRILFLQQAHWWDLRGGELLHEVEDLLAPFGRYHGYLTRSEWNPGHCVTFLREAIIGEPEMRMRHHWRGEDPDEDNRLYGFLDVRVGGTGGPRMWLRGVMLKAHDPADRLREIRAITSVIPDGVTAVVAGSFNSAASGKNEPQRDWDAAYAANPEKALHKGRMREDGSVVANTEVFDHLLGHWSPATAPRRLGGVGWISLAKADSNYAPTTGDGADKGDPLRQNDFLVNREDITVPGSSRTHPLLPHAAGRHRYITAKIAVS